MKKERYKELFFLFSFILLSFLILFCAFFLGINDLSTKEIFNDNSSGTLTPLAMARITRILASFLVGGSLALAGSVYQAVLHNPLAEPFILGVSGGAAVGTALAFITGAAVTGTFFVPLFASSGGLFAVLLVLLLGMTGRGEKNTILLSGVIMGTLSSSILMCLISFAGTQEMCSITWFLMGDLSAADPVLLRFSCFFAPLIAFLLFLLSPKANALASGEDYARGIGVDPVKTGYALLILATLLTAASVALSGIISFVGLIVPHILRKWGFADNRKLFPLSFFAGGIFLIFCDFLSRNIFQAREIPAGVITSFSGGLLFLWILYKKNLNGRKGL